MAATRALPGYRMLDEHQLPALLDSLPRVRARLGGQPDQWRIREVGDGNLNLVFIVEAPAVEGPKASVCVKQAQPYVRAAGPSWPMSLERAYFERSYYLAVAPHVGTLQTAHRPGRRCSRRGSASSWTGYCRVFLASRRCRATRRLSLPAVKSQ